MTEPSSAAKREVVVARLYERVMLIQPVHLDLTGGVMAPGAEATIVDLIDDGVVLLEFDFDAPELVGGKRFQSTFANVHDFVAVS